MVVSVDTRPLVVHVLHRFDTGGLENGVVNLINGMTAYRHAVVALTEVTAFKERVTAPGTQFFGLGKQPGQGFWLYPRLYRLLRELRPTVVHTRNLGALEFAVPAWAARVPLRLHGEHGYDISDPDGKAAGPRRWRRLYAPFVHGFIALSKDLQRYLTERVGVAPKRVHQLYNGVDTAKFAPRDPGETPPADWPFKPGEHLVIGAVGRMHPIKDPLNLVEAFILLLQRAPELAGRVRLAMLGGGVQLEAARQRLAEAGLAELCWLPGDRSDVARLMRWFDIYALPSRAEGISNTVLEAMACARPIVATAVGGTPELLESGQEGLLVPPADAEALAEALESLLSRPERAAALGQAAHRRVQEQFSLGRMVAAYQAIYDGAPRR
ncbi:TIGR03088 family PEP-CTERM/XrtA system glycosyltransferase [Pelomonas sp. SE-A7]|uniref:TIGR03088 family PEP-CTERM/XrtA system glycosyltransferase n=1 Tax=Pelomonas sp. SE-A7 TaxID=3054953 RepID=UPI00259D2803|nr:TIGR03088 family PEP-CTERM/XrtA system glycosyltransferase [Pelomonas sp. SE-A7]MDM4764878.1 TIGR03088 family PEP-CTERM/XrtA system glycosyltransferase [Pelomonas sp. SE-A7]